MSKSWIIQYTLLMASLFSITIGYNACSNDAGFALQEGVGSLEAFNQVTTESSIVINGGDQFTQQEDVNLTLDAGQLATEMRISSDASCNGNWEPYQTNRAWTLTQLNTQAEVYVQYRYQDDDPTPCVKDDIIHDSQAPDVMFLQGGESLWISTPSINVQFVANDPVSGVASVECDTTGSGQFTGCSQNLTFNGLVENQNYLLVVRATDRAGNVAEPRQINWRSDMTPPSVAFIQTPAAITADLTPTFVVEGTDLGSGVASYECKVDQQAAFTACNPRTDLSNLADGSHTFTVRAIDNVGRISSEASYSWVQDATAPTIEFTSTPGPVENNQQATFTYQGINAQQGIVEYQCRIDNAAYSVCSGTSVLNNLTSGVHNFSVIGRDSAGNQSSPITYRWTVDLVKPTIAFTETPSAVARETMATFGFLATDSLTGIAEIRCQLDNQAMAVCGNSRVFNGVGAGQHRVTVVAVDRAGNQSDPISYSWLVDNVAPTVTITSGPGQTVGNGSASFAFTGNDGNGSGISGYQCRVDGGQFVACTSPSAYSNITSGRHVFSVIATDNAGNTSAPATYDWIVDLDAPIIAFIQSPDPVTYIGNDAQIRFTVNDGNGSGLDRVECFYKGQPYVCAVDTSYAIPSVDISNHNFVVVAYDLVGNSATINTTWATQYNVVPRTAQYEVKADQPVDILFVVDNSGSMNAERRNLAQRIDNFLTKVDGLDWQLAVTTTDVFGNLLWEDGRLAKFGSGNNAPRILDPSFDQVQAQSLFGSTVQGIPEGSGDEQGIRAAVRVIERALDGSGGNAVNAQFLRTDASLAVVVLSDEDEDSDGLGITYSPQQFLDIVDNSYAGQKNVTWHSIVTMSGDQACKSAGYSYFGATYEALSRLTNGIIGSVCDQDYTNQLSNIGQAVRDMQKSLSLGCQLVDDDGDGNLDMVVTYQAIGSQNYVSFTQPYQIVGQTIVFDDFLPPGQFKLDYNCAN